MKAEHKLLTLRPDLPSKAIAEEAGKIAKVSFDLTLLDVLDNLAKLAMRNEPMPWEGEELELEGKKTTLPSWVNFIAKEPEGDYTGFEHKPLCKKPYGFWKLQQGREIELCNGISYEDGTGGDITEKHLWKVIRSPSGNYEHLEPVVLLTFRG